MELCDQDDAQEDLPRQREHLLSMPIDQQSTFNPWLLVDVVGSPRLTKLIGALTIDLCEDIPSLDLSAPYSDESDDDKDSMDLDGICSSMLYRKAHNQQSPAKTTSHSVSYRNTSLSSYFSNRTQRRMPGPLDELYPFPKSASPRQLFRRPRTNHLISGYAMKIKELECMKKFKTLKSMQPLEINELAEDMRSIAWRHYELEQFVLAESWWRRVVNSCLQIPGFQPFKVLQACLQVVSNVQLQGRHNEALSLHQRIHHKIVKLVGPNHQFAIFSKEKLANILRSLGENDSEIAIFREVLQYCLLQFGPRSRDTLDVLRFLGYALISGSQYREAEAILCHTVELDCELASCIDRDVIDAQNSLYSMTGLACSLNDQKRFEDSKSVLNTAEEWFKDTIKIESPFCWQYFRRRAVVLRCEGRLLESEEILRAVVNHAPDYPDIEIKLAMIELAEISMETGQQAEAATWWEKNFIMGGELWGFDYKCSRYDCEILGFCYARQGRYNDAILHFQQTIEKLALINGGNLGSRKKYIEVIEDWILEVEEMKEQHRRWNTEDSSTEGLSTENSSMEDATAS
jgi:tetratricopeptide (TPR) repeat protein